MRKLSANSRLPNLGRSQKIVSINLPQGCELVGSGKWDLRNTSTLHLQGRKCRLVVGLIRPINYNDFVRFEGFTAVTMKNGVFWDVAPCDFYQNRRVGGT
jgi:hypothetical protein